jgi:hypothetical protein
MKTLARCFCHPAPVPERRALHYEIARFAARLERERDRWTQRYLELLDTAVSMPHLEPRRPLEHALADGFAVRLAPVRHGADRNGYPGVRLLGAQLAAHLRAGKRVMVDLSDLAPRERARDLHTGNLSDLTTAARELARATGHYGLRYAPAGYSIRADHPDIRWFLQEFATGLAESTTCVIVVGDGPLEALGDAAPRIQLSHRLAPSRALIESGTAYRRGSLWVYREPDARELWALIGRAAGSRPNLHIALDTRAALANPLATSERGDTVVPGFGLRLPANAAHLPLVVDLRALVVGGHADLMRVECTVGDTVRMANRLFDQAAWPSEAARTDALCHRRLAIRLAGIGDVLARRHLDPTGQEAVNFARQVIRRARQAALQASALEARYRGPCAAMRAASSRYKALARLVPNFPHTQWAGLRNAQLIALSPFDFVPPRSGFTPRDLAPLLGVLVEADLIAAFPLPCMPPRSISAADLWLETWRALRGPPRSPSLRIVRGGADGEHART